MKRFHLIWLLVALSLALADLSGFAAVGLVREQRDASADLRGDVEQHRSVALSPRKFMAVESALGVCGVQ